MHDLGLLVTLAAALGAALGMGLVTQALRLSPIVGYLLAGVVIGPYTPGFVADRAVATQLAEVGVILLMFGVGLHFRPRDLYAVRAIAIPGALGQSLVAIGLGAALAAALGWRLGAGLALGAGISVASTVVLIRVLTEGRRLETPEGHVAVGWLIVEDVLTVILLVLLPSLAVAAEVGGGASDGLVGALVGAIGRVALLAALMLGIGGRVIPFLLARVARTRSRELFTLTVLALALVIATGAAVLFGVSMALGAFLAGMVVGQSPTSHQAAADALPLRDAFAVLFFVSVGMLFDPGFVLAEPWLVLGTLGIILLGKPLAAIAIVLALRHPVRTALTVAVGLAQIGEFSFILADVAHRLGVLPAAGQSALIAGALISITINPVLFRAVGPMEAWLRRREGLWSRLHRRSEARARSLNAATAAQLGAAEPGTLAVVVGYGPVGQTVTRLLREFGVQPVVVEMNIGTVTRLHAAGHAAIYGDASRPEVLRAAGIERARYLLVTPPDLPSQIPVVLAARELSPDVRVLVRAHYLNAGGMLAEIGATAVSYDEAEAAVTLAAFLLRDIGAPADRIEAEARQIRDELAARTRDVLDLPGSRRAPRAAP